MKLERVLSHALYHTKRGRRKFHTYDLCFSIDVICRKGSVNCLRTRGSVKSVLLPSPEEATPLGETPCCGEPAKVDGTISLGKLCERLRLMAGQRNNPSIMWQSAGLPAVSVIWKDMLGSQRLNGCRLAVMNDQFGARLRYSPAAHESAWIN